MKAVGGVAALAAVAVSPNAPSAAPQSVCAFSRIKGSTASVSPNRLSYGCPTTIFRDPGTDTDIISAQHFWTGRLETAGPGCYESRDRSGGGFPNAGYDPHPSCHDCSLTARSRPKRAAKTSRKIVAGQP